MTQHMLHDKGPAFLGDKDCWKVNTVLLFPLSRIASDAHLHFQFGSRGYAFWIAYLFFILLSGNCGWQLWEHSCMLRYTPCWHIQGFVCDGVLVSLSYWIFSPSVPPPFTCYKWTYNLNAVKCTLLEYTAQLIFTYAFTQVNTTQIKI